MLFRQLRYMQVIVYLCCETLGKGDRALVRSVACCDSYWCMILHPWESESAIGALCALSVLPRVLCDLLMQCDGPKGSFRRPLSRELLCNMLIYLTNTQIDWLEGLQNHTLSHSFRL